MLDYKKDEAATLAARFESDRSYVTVSGHVFLRGYDKTQLWDKLYRDQKGLCATCGHWRPEGKLDMDHERDKRRNMRCDCYGIILVDGTSCTNVSLKCTMHPAKGIQADCHRGKHNREVQLGTIR